MNTETTDDHLDTVGEFDSDRERRSGPLLRDGRRGITSSRRDGVHFVAQSNSRGKRKFDTRIGGVGENGAISNRHSGVRCREKKNGTSVWSCQTNDDARITDEYAIDTHSKAPVA